MTTRPCVDCGKPGTRTGRCADCTRARERRRGTAADRGYDAEHQSRAAALRAQQRACCLCGADIDTTLRAPHPLSFSAHHLTGDKRGPMDAAHLVCNERAGRPD